jgi:RNA polymerase sigma-70 factor (ECF subfamily)
LGVAFVNAPDDYIVVRQESQTVLEALSNLQPRDQEILRLSVWEELSHDQVAKTLGINVDAAKKRLSRARARLTSEYQRMTKNSHPPLLRKGGAQ